MKREDVLSLAAWHQRSEAFNPGRSLRMILEFGAAEELGELAAMVRSRLGLQVVVAPLFAQPDGALPDPQLVRFVAMTVVGVTLDSIEQQAFELAYAIADATGAATAEPELGTNFFVEPPETVEESISGVPGCWVAEADDIAPAQPFWAVDAIRARDAWAIPPAAGGGSRGEGIDVFQPDTGVANHDEIEAGMIDASRAYDFVGNRAGATDPLNYVGNPGHGTGTASVVASRTSGTMTGSAPLATLVPLRAIESVIVFDHGRVAAAVEYARRHGAHVITMSLGGAWSTSLRAAIRSAIADGVIVLAASGNCVGSVVWPARYEEVIAVAGTNIHDLAWKGTCRGEAVDISAPGEFVPRAKRNLADSGGPHVVAGGQGTSFAVAITAGVAALWLAHHGIAAVRAAVPRSESVQTLFSSLLKATARVPAGFDKRTMGAGIVDAKALIERGLAFVPAQVEEFVFDEYRSLHTLLAETGGEEASVAAINQRRFAAEASHHALARARARRAAGGAEAAGGRMAIPMSATMRRALRELDSVGPRGR